MAAEVNPGLEFHGPDGERVNLRGLRARTLDLEAVTAERADETLCHLASGRVVGAEDRDRRRSLGTSRSRGSGARRLTRR